MTTLAQYLATCPPVTCAQGHPLPLTPALFRGDLDAPLPCAVCHPTQSFQEQAEAQATQVGARLLSRTKGLKDLVRLQCQQGHVSLTVVRDLWKNWTCPHCPKPETLPPNVVAFRDGLATTDLLCLEGDPGQGRRPVVLGCPSGHRWTVHPNAGRAGLRCPHCRAGRISVASGAKS